MRKVKCVTSEGKVVSLCCLKHKSGAVCKRPHEPPPSVVATFEDQYPAGTWDDLKHDVKTKRAPWASQYRKWARLIKYLEGKVLVAAPAFREGAEKLLNFHRQRKPVFRFAIPKKGK